MTDKNMIKSTYSGPYESQAGFDCVRDVVQGVIILELQKMNHELLPKLQGILERCEKKLNGQKNTRNVATSTESRCICTYVRDACSKSVRAINAGHVLQDSESRVVAV